jgi:hypothetical protein
MTHFFKHVFFANFLSSGVNFFSNDLAWVGRRAEIGFSPLLFGPNLLLVLILFHGCFFSGGICWFEVMIGFAFQN